MTRFLALFAAAVAFAVTACERHPLPGQSEVTFTHGSGGTEPAEGHEAGAAKHEEAAKHEGAAKPEEKKAPGASEEAPKFFPEKK